MDFVHGTLLLCALLELLWEDCCLPRTAADGSQDKNVSYRCDQRRLITSTSSTRRARAAEQAQIVCSH